MLIKAVYIFIFTNISMNRNSSKNSKASKSICIMHNNKPTYEIEKIIEKRMFEGKVQYRVKWKDYPPSANTWEPVTNLIGCQELIDDFHRIRGDLPEKPEIAAPKLNSLAVDLKKAKNEVKSVRINRHQESVKSVNVPVVPIEIEDDSPPKVQESHSKKKKKTKEKRKRKLEIQDHDLGDESETPTNQSEKTQKKTLNKGKDEIIVKEETKMNSHKTQQPQEKVIEMMMDPQKNIYFKIQHKSQKEIISRSDLIERNIHILLAYYESKIIFHQ